MKPDFPPYLLCASVILLVLAAGPAWSGEPQTSVATSKHQVRVGSPVESSQFPDLVGTGPAPETLADASFPISPDWNNVLACTVRVSKQSQPQAGVRVSMSADMVDRAGRQTRLIRRARKTNGEGQAFFRTRVPDRSPPESFGWIARFGKKEMDYASGNCQMRSFAPCEESTEFCCVDRRYRVRVAYESGEPGSCLGNGLFDLGGEQLRIDIDDYCRRYGVKTLELDPVGLEIGCSGDPVEIEIVDSETGHSNLAWYCCGQGGVACQFSLEMHGRGMCAAGGCCP